MSRSHPPAAMYSFTTGSAIETHFPASELSRPVLSLRSLLPQFQSRYPAASLVAELLMVHEGNFVVRALVQMGGTILVSGMAAASDIELAEDRAKIRALESLTLQPTTPTIAPIAPSSYELQVQLSSNGEEAEDTASPVIQPSQELATHQPDSISDLVSTVDTDADIDANTNADAFLPSLPSEALEDLPLSEPIEVASTPAVSSIGSSSIDPVSIEALALPAPEPLGTIDAATHPSWDASPSPTSEASLHATTDLSDVIAQTTVELKRLGWTNAKGRTHLEQTYGKRSRQQLTDAELLDFLHYLELQPSPNQSPF